ncbi:MAG: site-specific integrase [Lachnospiraceae bacterium]|nr:site-specific integrase [Lachnospiraceae bacterium]
MATAIRREYKSGVSYRIDVSVKQFDGTYKKVSETYVPKAKSEKAIQKEIEEEKRRFENEVKCRSFSADAASSTFYDLACRFLENSLSISDRTRSDYEKILKAYVYKPIGALKISMIQPAHVEKIFKGMKTQSTATLKKALSVTSAVFTYGIKKERMNIVNPCGNVDLPKRYSEKKRTVKAFDLEEMRTFENAVFSPITKKVGALVRKDARTGFKAISAYTYEFEMPEMYKVLFILALKSGMRRGELVALDWKSVDFQKNKISVNKAVTKINGEQVVKGTKSDEGNRVITLPRSCMALLKQWKAEAFKDWNKNPNWPVFLDKNFEDSPVFYEYNSGNYLDVDLITKRFRRFLIEHNNACSNERDKLPVLNFHGLRHTCASYLHNAGMSIPDIASFMGHSPEVLLRVYSQEFDKEGEAAAECWEALEKKGTAKRKAI